jgi:hypothetical protein
VFENVVAVGQHVSKADDLVDVTNAVGEVRMVPSQSGQRLADDLEFALDDKLQPTVLAEIIEGLAVTERLDLLDGP